MLNSIAFQLESHWLAWAGLFPHLPFWSPHGAAMTLIVGAAVAVLGARYMWLLLHRN
ncbi:MAG: hypothetical protein QF578_03275 [Alphaproteobacteria bacterium]|jgi:hypothetical protein|nr:hypothetical protein [Alphaproteobacteria bacterium]MDP6811740.1 hypothetical protein [Alphaproteobacteria bacterium]